MRLPHARFQPIAADNVAAALAEVVLEDRPRHGVLELAGPDALPMDEFVRRFLGSTTDARPVVADAGATYFGAAVDDASLTPGQHPPPGRDPVRGPGQPALAAAARRGRMAAMNATSRFTWRKFQIINLCATGARLCCG